MAHRYRLWAMIPSIILAMLCLLLWMPPPLLQCLAMTLEEALTRDMIPSSSSSSRSSYCDDSSSSKSTHFNFAFSSSNHSTVFWNPQSAAREPLVFLVEMRHEDPRNSNRSWTIRLGTGGQVHSWRGPYGEAIPPQYKPTAAWIDTVLQMVAVNGNRNSNKNAPCFIHQAGTYQNDPLLQDVPFYSPTLAMHCADNHCDVASWGQQAHVPTTHRSDVLYYIRYRNCGDGIVEVTQVVHNAADVVHNNNNDKDDDVLTYLNVPWTGLRHSTFHDVLLSSSSNQNGTTTMTAMRHEFPMRQFGSQRDVMPIPNLRDMGGITTFAQKLPPPPSATVPLPCVVMEHQQNVNNKKKKKKKKKKAAVAVADCDDPNVASTPLQLIVQRPNPCEYVQGLSDFHGQDVVRIELYAYNDTTTMKDIPGCRRWCGSANGIVLVNARTEFQVPVTDVVHWVWGGRFLYVVTGKNVTAEDINREWKVGDEIFASMASVELEPNDNLALTFVHGIDRESSNPNNTWITKPSRMRHGAVLNVKRDLIIYTINFIGKVKPGETYVNRQFIMSGELQGMQDRAMLLVNETKQTLLSGKDHRGRNLTLYTTNTSYTVALDNTECQEGTLRCRGSTTPSQKMSHPLFYITCGNTSHVGSDQYHFAPPRETETEPLRPYICHGHSIHVRPSWKLLGYFAEGDCRVKENLTYNANLCTTTSAGSSWSNPHRFTVFLVLLSLCWS